MVSRYHLQLSLGTMSPFEHGETFVLDDGGETDLDLGNYERFLDLTLTARHNITTGKVYRDVIQKERRGDYLGKTVQIVPHLTDVIQDWIREVAHLPVDGSTQVPEVCLIEVGGTVGDIESMVFLEALRQLLFAEGRQNCMLVHLSLVPCVGGAGEQKTKPTQHSVKELCSLGLFPDLVVCRCASRLGESTKLKLSNFCHVQPSHVISVHDVSNIYFVPLILVEQGVHRLVKETLHLDGMSLDAASGLKDWETMAHRIDSLQHKISVAIVGKYTGHSDSYLSVVKSLTHSGIHLNADVRIVWIEATDLEQDTLITDASRYERAWAVLRQEVCGIIVPGGFGVRGIEGKVAAAKYARESGLPYLGLCLGMQVMVIEYCRSILLQTQANSVEFDEHTNFPAIVFMPEGNQVEKGGTMRLGARDTQIKKYIGSGSSSNSQRGEVSTAWELYGLQASTTIAIDDDDGIDGTIDGMVTTRGQSIGIVSERHRHRYEVNPSYVPTIEEHGLYFSGRGVGEYCNRMEIAELPRSIHKFYVGAQFHPEFKSRPNCPAPLVFGFVASCLAHLGIEHVSYCVAGRLWQAASSSSTFMNTTATTFGTTSILTNSSSASDEIKTYCIDASYQEHLSHEDNDNDNNTRRLKRTKVDDSTSNVNHPSSSNAKVDGSAATITIHPSPLHNSQPSTATEALAGTCSPIKPWNEMDANK